MLINRLSEANDRGTGNGDRVDDHAQEYHTASELFDIMAKDQLNVNDALSANNLVLLYRNLDVETNILPDSNTTKRRPNQHVETVVYEDDQDSEESDISEICGTEDADVYDFNKERLDLLNNSPSLKNSLCQKFGGIKLKSSNLNNAYHQHFNIFQDSYIKDQLNYSFGIEEFDGAVLPATLLDYICCKRLEDNYNFYMDNIIRYVKHTIEQLKRISNGDYLTDKAKEKWREVIDPVDQSNNTKILATSTSIPLHIERKTSKLVTAWDDIVHSEVDIRSLSKILEKKIIVEVPKLICGTYKLFSRRCADNLIISCKRENNPTIKEEKEEDSRVDVVVQLEKSPSGKVVSNISSIMILKAQQDVCLLDPLPLPYKKVDEPLIDVKDDNLNNKLQIVELDNDSNDNVDSMTTIEPLDKSEVKSSNCNQETYDGNEPNYDLKGNSSRSSSSPKCRIRAAYEDISPNETAVRTQSFTTSDLPSEDRIQAVSSNTLIKKKSPTRNRIKSPYENQSHILEEKKRRRLLEIREKREKKKMALGENCKISKHKYSRGGILPQASNSVTKLSITNKSFYNSIYGQPVPNDQAKTSIRKAGQNDSIPEVPLDQEGDYDTRTDESKKYINRSYYLDDTVTEMMYMEMKKNDNNETKGCSASTSVVSSDFRANLTLLSQLIGPSVTDLGVKLNQVNPEGQTLSSNDIITLDIKEKKESKGMSVTQSIINLAPANTPKEKSEDDLNDPKKISSSVECRKSIDKIYDLMKKLEKGDEDNGFLQRNKVMTAVHMDRVDSLGRRVSSTIQGSDSGTSLKHHLTSSNPSCFSFEKANTDIPKLKATNKKVESPVVPKVIISNRTQVQKPDAEKLKKPKKPVTSPMLKTQDNPLKAISQLLHEFDNVQKCRQKSVKANKKPEANKALDISNEVKSSSYQGLSKGRSRLELHLKEIDILNRPPKVVSPRKLRTSLGFSRMSHPQVPTEDSQNKTNKRKITDIIDEVKEARGEAVKGPSKFNSRLNSLAQPKKSYVQARIEEHPPRSIKTFSDRQTKLATVPSPTERTTGSANSKNKAKRIGTEAASSVSVKQPPVQPLDKAVKMRRSANSSPEDRPKSPVSTSKRNNVPPKPETLKKMVAVESYVKSHYRRAPPSPVRERAVGAGHKSRIPLLPQDIELASIESVNIAEESTEVGSKLHNMISTILDMPPSHAAFSEHIENSSRKTIANVPTIDECSKGDEKSSGDSDYGVDVFEDKHIVTAVEHVPKIPNEDPIFEEDAQMFKSATEIQMLESSLSRKWPIGAFQKRLRIKNLTLTPKHSMTQVLVLQSGDDRSLVIESSMSKTINTTTDDKIHDLKALPVLSKTKLDWNFINFPIQIATIGYAFPHYQSHFKSNSETKIHGDIDKNKKKLNIALGCPEKSKIYDNDPKLATKDIPQDSKDEDEPSKPAFNVKPEEDIQGLVNSFEAAISKSYKNSETALIKPPKDESLPIQTTVKPIEKSELENINYTTSLDMLVGLLNEIQKITSCQTHITTCDGNEQQCKELDTILVDAAAVEAISKVKTKELGSITSLDKLRNLESTPSIYTLYLSSDNENDKNSKSFVNITTDAYHPFFIDKEVNVDMGNREYISRFTDVPSTFPININRSTNVTNSLIGLLSQPSSQSMLSYMEYQTLNSNTSFNACKKIIQLPQHAMEETKEIAPKHVAVVCKEKEQLNEKNDVMSFKLYQQCEKIGNIDKKLIRFKKSVKKETYVSELDPMLKVKRDILVTVYSILVFTVFAALSFPEVLYPI